MNYSHMKIHCQNGFMVSNKNEGNVLFVLYALNTHTRGERERKRCRPAKEKLIVSAKKKVDFLLTDMLTLAHCKTECLNSRQETKMTESTGLFFRVVLCLLLYLTLSP